MLCPHWKTLGQDINLPSLHTFVLQKGTISTCYISNQIVALFLPKHDQRMGMGVALLTITIIDLLSALDYSASEV